MAITFNELLSDVVKELKIGEVDTLLCKVIEETLLLLREIENYTNHPSTLRIKNYLKGPCVFSFKYFNVEDVKMEINNIDSKRATPNCDIPAQIVKQNSDIIAPILTTCFNQNINNSTFLNEMKNIDTSSVYKKNDHHDKSNYRVVSILPF